MVEDDPEIPGANDRGGQEYHPPEQRRAVLVGVNDDDEVSNGIRFCGNDMRELRDVLVEQGYNVTLLVQGESDDSTEPWKADIETALSDMCRKAGASDTVLFAFAGHGVEAGSDCYLMPCGADSDDLAGTAVSMRFVRDCLTGDQCAAKSKFIIIDACHSGGGVASNPEDAEVNQENFLPAGTDIWGLFSCGRNQVSYEDQSLSHGVFTYYLLRGLRGEADLVGTVDQQVTIDEVYHYVHHHVEAHQVNGNDINQTPFRRVEGSGDPVLSTYERRPDVEMLTLPGLTGQWWFKETPWLLPDIRQRMAQAHSQTANHPLPDGSSLADDGLRSSAVDQLHERLWSEFDAVRHELSQDRKIVVGLIGEWRNISPDESKDRVLALLQGDTSFYSLYSLAVVQHYLGMPEAGDSFEAALAHQEIETLPKGLHARLLADYAQFLLETDQLVEAKLQFEDAMQLVTANDAPLFWIECELGRANSLRRLTHYDDAKAALDKALGVATDFQVPEDHPLVAYIHKSIGWLYMDEWRLEDARKSFLQSNAVIAQASVDGFEGLPVQDQVFIAHNLHGLAMVERYSGNPGDAEEQYLQLIDDIQAARDAADGTSGVTALTERLVNTQERLADTYLFVPGASRVSAALSVLSDAANEARNLTGSSAVITRARLKLKIAISLALEGNANEAQDYLDEFEGISATLSDDSRRKLELYQRAAQGLALLLGSKTSMPEGTAALTKLLDEAQDEQVRDLYSRDDFDVLLLIGTRLVQSNSVPSAVEEMRDDAEELIGIIPLVGDFGVDAVIDTGVGFLDDPQARADMLFENVRLLLYALPSEYRNLGSNESSSLGVFRYLRGFYDVCLSGALSYSLQEGCQVPMESRGLLAIAKTGSSTLRLTYREDNRQVSMRPGEPALICYVPNGAESGWAILFPNRTVFALGPWTESGSSLPDDLHAAIGDLPGLQVHWSDEIHGWTEEDLPFDVPSAQPAN